MGKVFATLFHFIGCNLSAITYSSNVVTNSLTNGKQRVYSARRTIRITCHMGKDLVEDIK